jgi:hypothetical protein
MNAARRKDLERARILLADAKAILEQARDEEQDAFDAMPESIQQGPRGDKGQAAVDALDEAVNACDEIDSNIDTARE